MSVPSLITDAVERVMRGVKKRTEAYLTSFKDKKNARLLQYYRGEKPTPSEKVKLTIQYPTEQKKFVDVPYELNAIIHTELQVDSLHFEKVDVFFDFPAMLLGSRGIVPQIVYKIKSPVAYPGNMGLVWEAISEDVGKWAFHPFGSKSTMKKDLLGYYKEGVVDQFCDTLNRGNQKAVKTLQNYVSEIANGKNKRFFKYQPDPMQPNNTILVPIIGEFDEKANITTFSVRSWALGEDWIPAEDVIFNILEPLAIIVSLFDEKGDLKQQTEAKEEIGKLKPVSTGNRRVLLDVKDRVRDRSSGDPFKLKEKKVERDEFGFFIDKKKGFSGQDVQTARSSIMDIEKKLKVQDEQKPETRDLSHVQNYPSAEAFYNENQGKNFIVKGDAKGLSFIDKANLDVVKSCSPPFILRYARDQIRLKRQLTSAKAMEILFSIYKLGFLFEA